MSKNRIKNKLKRYNEQFSSRYFIVLLVMKDTDNNYFSVLRTLETFRAVIAVELQIK